VIDFVAGCTPANLVLHTKGCASFAARDSHPSFAAGGTGGGRRSFSLPSRRKPVSLSGPLVALGKGDGSAPGRMGAEDDAWRVSQTEPAVLRLCGVFLTVTSPE
jgi:hypothetical protein